MTALITDYDIEYDGVIINSGESTSPYAMIEAEIFGGADIRTSDGNRGQQDGQYPGIDLYAGRDITLEVEIWAENSAALRTAYLDFLTAVRKRLDEKVLRFKLPNWPDLRVLARPRKVAGPKIDLGFNQGTRAVCTIQFHCTDPRFYSDLEFVANASITATVNGLAFDAAFDLNFGGVGTSNQMFVSNDGNYDAPWRAVITGPITNPILEHIESGKSLALVGSVLDGETLVIESQPGGGILLNGTASRYSWLQDASQWFLLQPGMNTVQFRGSSAGIPTINFYWRSAWVL